MRAKAGTVEAAAQAVVAHVNRRMESWRELNYQIRWTIDDEVAAVGIPSEVCGNAYAKRLTAIKQAMEDGQPWYWQRFLMLPDAERRAAILAAAGRQR